MAGEIAKLDEVTSRWCSVVNAKSCSIVKMVARIFASGITLVCFFPVDREFRFNDD